MAIGKTYVDDVTATLIKLKYVSHDEGEALKKAFHESAQEIFDDFLIEEGLIEPDQLLKALSIHYQVPSFDVVGYFFDHDLLHQFNKGFLLRNAIIPLELDENILIVVASEPDLPNLLEDINEFVSYDVRFYVGLQRDICDAVKEFYDKAPTQVKEDIDLREERILAREEREEELEDEEEFGENFLD